MANKKNNTVPYGAMSIPSVESRYSILRWGWNGLNRTDVIDSGNITACSGVMVKPPYVDVCAELKEYKVYTDPLGIFGFDDFLLVTYKEGDVVKLARLGKYATHTATLSLSEDAPRSIVQFNVAVNTENIVEAEYVRKLLIFPDKQSVNFDPDDEGGFTLSDLEGKQTETDEDGKTTTYTIAFPGIKYATVYGSRLFGVDDEKVYASAFNNYANWDLDTADDTSEANAWVSMTQSNVKADGYFTGIYTYDNHVVLFKKDFTQLVYNNKNPFRVVDLTAYGADNPYAIAEAGGILYFASSDNVYAFTGGTPKAIGDELGIANYSGVTLGSFKDKLYMCVGTELYLYRDGVWSARELGENGHIVQFAANDNGLYGLQKALGKIVVIDSDAHETAVTGGGGDSDGLTYGSWWFETDLMCAGKLDVRRVKKLSVLCELADDSELAVYLVKDGKKVGEEDLILTANGSGGNGGRRLLRGMVRGFGGYAHKLRFVGKGKARIYAAELLVSWGGDVYKNG